MLKDDFHMSPYKIYVIQELSEDDKQKNGTVYLLHMTGLMRANHVC